MKLFRTLLRPKVLLLLSTLLLLAGSGLLIFIIRSQATGIVANPQVLNQRNHTAVHTTAAIEGEPISIEIPSLGKNLPVIPGVYDPVTRKWTLTTDKVQYAVMTPKPNNEAGSTFLYGHYRRNVFASLHTLKQGDEAIVKTSNGRTFYYRLAGSKVVSPEDSADVFDYKGAPLLTIQTCTGLFFQNRQLFFFDFEKVV